MVSGIGCQVRVFLLMSLAACLLFRIEFAEAEEAASLPSYVIEKFGKPPAVPSGPLSEALQSAVQGRLHRQQHPDDVGPRSDAWR